MKCGEGSYTYCHNNNPHPFWSIIYDISGRLIPENMTCRLCLLAPPTLLNRITIISHFAIGENSVCREY
jgi:hypothetical protein